MKKLLFLLFVPVSLSAQTVPYFDNTFSDDGRLTTSIWNNNYARSVAVQPDHKILVGGNMSRTNPSNQSYFVARYKQDGTLDDSFGTEGLVYQANNNGAWIMSMKVQSDGNILLAGRWGAAPFVGRMLPDGSFDPDFGTQGINTWYEDSGYVRDMHVFDDGSFLVYGSVGFTNNLKAIVARFHADGSLDASFGTNGQFVTDFGYQTLINNAMVVQPDGKFIISGAAVPSPSAPGMNQLFLARFDAQGNPDASFGTDGLVTNTEVTLEARDIALDSQQRIVVVGEKDIVYAGTGTAGRSVITRFLADGSRDLTFNQTGQNTVDVHAYAEYASAVLVDGSDRIYFTGHYFGGTGNIFRRYVARFTADGSLDPQFGTAGIFLSDLANYTGESELGNNNMVLTTNGKLVVGGYINAYLSNNVTLMRLVVDESALGQANPSENALVVYPNPTNDVIRVNSSQTPALMQVYGINGRLLLSAAQTKVVDMSNFSSGVYLLKLQLSDGSQSVHKVVKR